MPEPINPIENGGPLDNMNPFDDPLLDALEKSIESPPGFTDPLSIEAECFVDDLAKQLDAVEASIEKNTGLLPFEPEGNINEIGEELQSKELVDSESPSILNDNETVNIAEHLWNQSDSQPPRPKASSSRMLPPNPPELHMLKRGSGHAGKRKGLPKSRRTRGKTGLTVGSQMTRYCPEIQEVISNDKCDDCEKYQHWPEGTDEEPRECWHDWQEKPPSDDFDGDIDDSC